MSPPSISMQTFVVALVFHGKLLLERFRLSTKFIIEPDMISFLPVSNLIFCPLE